MSFYSFVALLQYLSNTFLAASSHSPSTASLTNARWHALLLACASLSHAHTAGESRQIAEPVAVADAHYIRHLYVPMRDATRVHAPQCTPDMTYNLEGERGGGEVGGVKEGREGERGNGEEKRGWGERTDT